jgi:adenine-specific DNA-methyltransferase
MANTYENKTREELLKIIEELEQKKKYGLVWDEERIPEQVVQDCQNNLPVLKEVKGKEISTNDNEPTHILIEGDNYHALSVLNYTHKNKIDVIYIDPPYNTGNKDFIYNDKFVDKEDTYRHSKWLAFMKKRLELARNLLKDTGVIFISIDDNEVVQLKFLCDHFIFDEKNFIANFVRRNKVGSGHDSGEVAIEFDYMLCYAKDKNKILFNKEIIDVESDPKYKFTDEYEKKRGKYYLRDLDYKGSYSETLDYGLNAPDGKVLFAGGKLGKPNTWRWSDEKVDWGKQNGFIVFKKDKNDNWKVYIKQYQFVDNEDNPRIRELPYRALVQFLNSDGSQELRNILKQEIFSYPKPTALIKFISSLVPNKNATVLDFFSGSGTTGHAIISLNKKDGGNRQFILCTNNENNICTDVCYPRVQKVMKGYKNSKGKKFVRRNFDSR